MALQGSYTYKGIDISEAYLVVSHLDYNKNYKSSQNITTEAVYAEDGSLVTPAEYETVWTTTLTSVFQLNIYKDAASKSSNPTQFVDSLNFKCTISIADDADNFVAQAYTYLKTLDQFNGYTDV